MFTFPRSEGLGAAGTLLSPVWTQSPQRGHRTRPPWAIRERRLSRREEGGLDHVNSKEFLQVSNPSGRGTPTFDPGELRVINTIKAPHRTRLIGRLRGLSLKGGAPVQCFQEV